LFSRQISNRCISHYEDYKNKNQIKYENVDLSGNKLVCKTKGNSDVKYAIKDIWGFKLEYQLFRCEGSKFYYVSYYGKVTMYANGKENFNGMKGNYTYTAYQFSTYFLSSGLGEEIYPQSAYRKFKEAYPQHQILFDCMGNSKTYNKFVECLKIYNSTR